jgi:hypothetical protein
MVTEVLQVLLAIQAKWEGLVQLEEWEQQVKLDTLE